MSWRIILADLADILRVVENGLKHGKSISKIIEEEGYSARKLIFQCGSCGAKSALNVKHVIDRHAAGQVPNLPTTCSDPNCQGDFSYSHLSDY